jgi:SAM-dependent methyltransferase
MLRPRPTRQPEPALDWYASAAGQGLLAVEHAAMARVLAGAIASAPGWLWLGVPGAAPPESERRRGLLLRRGADGFEGDVRCALPLPLASESLGVVLVQHVLDDAAPGDPLLEECARVLAPGGVLWLAVLNPWSPYRARWARSGLHAHDPGRWQRRLRRAGFAVDSLSLQWLGPRWRSAHGDVGVGAADRLRAGVALTVGKRTFAAIPPAPLRKLRWQASRTACTESRSS